MPLRFACHLLLTLLISLAGCQTSVPAEPVDTRPVSDQIVRHPYEMMQGTVEIEITTGTDAMPNHQRERIVGVGVSLENETFLTMTHGIEVMMHAPGTLRINPRAGWYFDFINPHVKTIRPDRDSDLTQIIYVPKRLTPKTFRVSLRQPRVGDKVFVMPASRNRDDHDIRVIPTEVVGVSIDNRFFAIAIEGMDGDSGSPICDGQGRLVGLISGGSDKSIPSYYTDAAGNLHTWRWEAIPELFKVKRHPNGHFEINGTSRSIFGRIYNGPNTICSTVVGWDPERIN
ncbi:serine protease family protein [Mucisphaera calidilacus]|uniref:Serine protease n=1 Tax=Mucisphaera calidilacus TaxID=2527982 RepID=A0A518C117_9BACT|nr:hypothetical protein [Mucisphaera calidilacus]QDU72925.1 hypothetical protein Pan265_28010 [Mucisphaera calidilacus]